MSLYCILLPTKVIGSSTLFAGICCQYQSTDAPLYFSYLMPVSVYRFTTVLQIYFASISLPMHYNTSAICCQYLSTDALHYFIYLLPASVYRCTTLLLLSVVSISLPMHHSISVICCQYQSTDAPLYLCVWVCVDSVFVCGVFV